MATLMWQSDDDDEEDAPSQMIPSRPAVGVLRVLAADGRILPADEIVEFEIFDGRTTIGAETSCDVSLGSIAGCLDCSSRCF